jgi:hypothetical protein
MLAKQPKVLGSRLERSADGLRQLADRSLSLLQQPQHQEPPWVSQHPMELSTLRCSLQRSSHFCALAIPPLA